LLLSLKGSYQNLPKPFRFEAFWKRDSSSHEVVAEAWLPNLRDSRSSPAFSLSRKWKSTKSALKWWNQNHFGNIQYHIKKLFCEIDFIQSYPHSLVNVAKEKSLQVALQEQLLREEVLWKQKSRELWLTCTDLNTSFFHAATSCRRRYKSISFLNIEGGSILTSRDAIGNHLVNHFSNLFSSSGPNLDPLKDLFEETISVEENTALCLIPDEVEIFNAISNLGQNKAPGPNGMAGLFYKTYWNIVKQNVVDSV
jgi:hypothetical protein